MDVGWQPLPRRQVTIHDGFWKRWRDLIGKTTLAHEYDEMRADGHMDAMRLERRFDTLSVPGRLRLGLGTSQVVKAPGWERKRQQLRAHVPEILEALESIRRLRRYLDELEAACILKARQLGA